MDDYIEATVTIHANGETVRHTTYIPLLVGDIIPVKAAVAAAEAASTANFARNIRSEG